MKPSSGPFGKKSKLFVSGFRCLGCDALAVESCTKYCDALPLLRLGPFGVEALSFEALSFEALSFERESNLGFAEPPVDKPTGGGRLPSWFDANRDPRQAPNVACNLGSWLKILKQGVG